MNLIEIRDNGGTSFDRYTAVYDKTANNNGDFEAIGMSSNPFHPQGFGQHCAAQPGEHLGKLIRFRELPEDCQECILMDLDFVTDPDGSRSLKSQDPERSRLIKLIEDKEEQEAWKYQKGPWSVR